MLQGMLITLLYAAMTGFLARYLAAVLDNWMNYTMVLGKVRYLVAKRLEPLVVQEANEDLPGDVPFDSLDNYYSGMYGEICKSHYWFRPLCCQYCMSFWILLCITPVFWPLIHNEVFYILSSIAFKHVFFRV